LVQSFSVVFGIHQQAGKMSKIALFYGTQTSYTQTAIEAIQQELGDDSVVTLYDISKAEPSNFEGYKYIIIGCPIWTSGEL
jgi:flavodoxin I